MIVVFCMDPLSLPHTFLHAAPKSSLHGFLVAGGRSGGQLEFERGFLKCRAASVSREPRESAASVSPGFGSAAVSLEAQGDFK